MRICYNHIFLYFLLFLFFSTFYLNIILEKGRKKEYKIALREMGFSFTSGQDWI
jgi:hypothetical protein